MFTFKQSTSSQKMPRLRRAEEKLPCPGGGMHPVLAKICDEEREKNEKTEFSHPTAINLINIVSLSGFSFTSSVDSLVSLSPPYSLFYY